MRINLVSRDNGVGLTRDMALLESILTPAGHQVRRVDWGVDRFPPVDVAIHLELLNPRLMRYARHNVGIFNLEWFQPAWRRHLGGFRQLWAKSLECYETLRRWRLQNVHHTGFLGRDLYDPGIPREPRAVHLAGHSNHKNTDAVIAAWRQLPPDQLPPLTVISHNPREVPPHVRLLSRISDAELVAELNAAQIHLCPSRAEGWGHYIVEAMSAGALVITTDGSPMNEHIRPEHGILVRPSSIGRTHAAAAHAVSADSVAAAARTAMLMSPAEREKMGQAARAHLLARNARFTKTALDLLRQLR